MAGELAGEDTGSEWRSEMMDLSGMSLAELAELTEGDESALARSVRRLAAGLDHPAEPIAGFNSAL